MMEEKTELVIMKIFFGAFFTVIVFLLVFGCTQKSVDGCIEACQEETCGWEEINDEWLPFLNCSETYCRGKCENLESWKEANQ